MANRTGMTIGVGVALGAGLGAAMGVIFGNIAMGVGVGVAIGTALGAGLAGTSGDKDEEEDEGPSDRASQDSVERDEKYSRGGRESGKPSFLLQFGLAMLGFAALLIVAIILVEQVERPVLRVLLVLLPLAPAVFMIRVITLAIGVLDELEQRIMLQSLAISLSGTAVVALMVGLLENAGLAQPNWTWLIPVICALWLVGQVMAGRKYG